jgi:hypothetical protein
MFSVRYTYRNQSGESVYPERQLRLAANRACKREADFHLKTVRNSILGANHSLMELNDALGDG